MLKRASFTHLLIGAVLMTAAGCSETKSMLNANDTFFAGDPDVVVKAAVEAVEELGFRSVTSAASKVDGTVEAYTARDKKVQIKVKAAGDNVSKVTVKVGSMGDPEVEGKIMDATRKRLK